MRPHLASLVEEFRRHAAETAVVAHRGNRRYATTYGQLATLAGRVSAELERRHIAPGDRVVLWGQNSAEWIAAFFGCLLRGVIAVPLDAAGSADFAVRVIRDTIPKLILADPGLLASLPANEQQTIDREQTPTPSLDLTTLADHLPAEPLFTVNPAVNQQTPFQIVFTSGTTSEPRGIVHTHRNVLVTLQPIENEIAKYRRYERIFHPLRFLHSLPLSHVFGQFMGLWIPGILAAELHFSDQFEPSRILDLIHRERISVLIAVPRVLHLLRTHLLAQFPGLQTQLDQSTGIKFWKRWWRFRRVHRLLGWKFWAVISGGATLPAELESFYNRLGLALIQGYGMTETSALVTLNHPFHIKQGTIGKPLPGREVKITDSGEILVRGDMLSGATWSGGQMRPREGEWLATGDLAEREPTGDLRFLGRKGDVIVTGAGMNIHPADLEAAMLQQPGVRACAVVSCDLPAGPEPVAVVLFSPPQGQPADAALQTAVASANLTLAEYQQIRRVLRWPELQFPYTSTGKLIRRQIAPWACAALHSSQPPSQSPGNDTLLNLIASVTGEPIPSTSDPNALRLSEDLHLDSLGRVQLQSALEQRLAIDLDDDDLATIQTIADLRTLLANDRRAESSAASSPAPSSPPAPSPWLSSRGAAEGSASSIPAPATPHEPNTYPTWPSTWPIQTLRSLFLELILRPLVWFLAAPRITRETPTLPDMPYLLIANHVTAYDGALVLYALPARLRRRVAIAMSGELLLDLRHGRNQGNWFLNLLAPAGYWLVTALFNVFPLPRARGFRSSFAHAGRALDRGYSVLIFPEGTRSHTTHMNPFRPGIGLLAQESRVPILPIALAGLGQLRASGSRWFRSGQLEVRVGAAIPVAALPLDDPAAVTSQLEQALHALFPPAQDSPTGNS